MCIRDSKYTNYGYGYVDGKDTASRIAGRVSSNGYAPVSYTHLGYGKQ